MRTSSRPGRVFGPSAVRRNVTDSSVPSNTGVADAGAGRDEFGGREIGDDALQADGERFGSPARA